MQNDRPLPATGFIQGSAMTVSSATTTPMEFIRFAEELVDASRVLIRSRFRRNADVEMKPDNTPVTATDLEV
jgi:hypothetical protein